MKRFFSMTRSAALAGVLLITAMGFAPVPASAQAQELPPYSCGVDTIFKTCDKSNPASGSTPASETSCEYSGLDTRVTTCKTTFEGGMTQECTKTDSPVGDGLFKCTNTQPSGTTSTTEQQSIVGQVTGAIAGGAADVANTVVVKPIVMFILMFAGWALGIAGVFFNQVVIKTVFQFSTYFGTSDGLLTAWGVMRDIANIGLLFGFIFMGVLLILNVDGGGHGHGHGGGISAKRAIPRLIIFAVLLNFSLFASQAVIDVSNAFASSFTTLAGGGCEAGQEASEGDNSCANIGISGKVMQMAGMGTIWDEGIINAFDTSTVTLLGLTLFVTITAIVLLAAGLMLIARVVILTLLMVTSPIGFAGMVIPGLQSLANRWWHTLISQAFFAPVMLLLVFISLKMAESLNPEGTPLVKAFAGANYTLAGNLEVLVVFAVVIGMMIASLIAASKMGAMGASFATNTASAVVLGGIARGTNFTVGGVGRVGRYAAQNLPGNKDTAFRRGITNLAFRPLEKANLDMRRAPGMGALLGQAGITAGAKPAEHATYGDMAHQVSDIRNRTGSAKRTAEYRDEMKKITLEKEAHDESSDPSKPMSDESKAFLSKLSTKELESLHGIQEGVDTMARNLTSEQFGALMKSDTLSDGQKGALSSGRFKNLVDAAALPESTPTEQAAKRTAVKAIIKNMSKSDLENMPPTVLVPGVLNTLSDKQRDDLGGSDKLSAQQRAAVKGSSKQARFEAGYRAAATAADRYAHVTGSEGIRNLSVAQVAKLDADILTDATVATELTPAMLIKLQDEEKLSAANIATIGNHIRSTTASAGHAHVTGAGAAFWT